MAIIWPQSLPQSFLIEGYSDSMPDTSITSSVSAGVPKKRQRYTATVTPVTGKMFMTKTQVNVLEQFYRETLLGGTLPFDLRHPRKGTVEQFRFRRPPTPEPEGIDWKVTLELELMP